MHINIYFDSPMVSIKSYLYTLYLRLFCHLQHKCTFNILLSFQSFFRMSAEKKMHIQMTLLRELDARNAPFAEPNDKVFLIF